MSMLDEREHDAQVERRLRRDVRDRRPASRRPASHARRPARGRHVSSRLTSAHQSIGAGRRLGCGGGRSRRRGTSVSDRPGNHGCHVDGAGVASVARMVRTAAGTAAGRIRSARGRSGERVRCQLRRLPHGIEPDPRDSTRARSPFGGGAAIEPVTFSDDAGEYSEVTGAVRLRTADDRTITVRCGPTPTAMGPAAALSESTTAMCADPAQADPIDAPALRGIAAQLAAMPVDAIGNVVIKPIPAEVSRRVEIELPTLFGVESTSVGDMYDVAVRVSGWGDDLLAPSTVLTVIGNVFGPPRSSNEGEPSDVSTGPPVAAVAGVTGLLVVSGNTAVHVATTTPTDGMHDRMTQLLGDPGATDRSLPVPETIGSEPIDSNVGPDIVASPEQEYAVLAGDYPLKVADLFGITIDELVAYNDWTSVAEFPGVGGIVKIPPGTTELTAVTDTTVLGVVSDSEQAEAIAELLNGVPVPDGFDVAALESGTTDDRYQFIAQVSGAVACAWLDQWFTGQETQDPDLQSAAAAALATSHTWPMLTEIADQGGWSDELWLHADAVNGGAGVMTGNGPSAPTRSEANSALGCHI